jgi:Phage terminase, small subunit
MMKSPLGFPVQSPFLAIANRQTEIMMRIASEFGFTPASRSRISTPIADDPSLLDLMEEVPPSEPDEPGYEVSNTSLLLLACSTLVAHNRGSRGC